MLAGKGFDKVMNMSGGIKAWDDPLAVGPQEHGLDLFDGHEAPDQTLQVAYSLEAGLHDFYVSMMTKVSNPEVSSLFKKLSDIEINHQNRLFEEYLLMTQKTLTRDKFDRQVESVVLEGGLTTDEYIAMFNPDMESPGDIVSLAMSIEAQALDLYSRAADRVQSDRSREVLHNIAQEERMHLEQLGQLIDNL